MFDSLFSKMRSKGETTHCRPFSAESANHLKRNNIVALITQRIVNAGVKFKDSTARLHWLAVASTVCFAVTYILQVIALFTAKDDIYRLFECISVTSFCSMGVLKLISLYRNHKHWNQLLNVARELEKEQSSNGNSSNVEYDSDDDEKGFDFAYHIRSYTAKFQTISTLLSRMYGSTTVIYIVSPYIEYALLKGTQEGWPHILPCWTPLDKNFIGYLFAIFIELVAAVYCVCVHVAFDLTSVGIMIFLCGQFSTLRDYSETIGGKGKEWRLSKKRDARAHHRIARCHRTHVLLMRSCDTLSKLLKNILGFYFFVATLTLCSVAVRLNSELSSMELVSLLQYMCATLTQLFLYCRYGDDVLHESSVSMGQGPFGSAYWCLSPHLRKELLILGMGMMIPRRFYAGPFTRLDLPSFIQVVRTAYSYYAVIRK